MFLLIFGVSKPPSGADATLTALKGTAAGFPETNEMSFGGSRVSGGRSLRDFRFVLNFIVTRSPSPDFVGSSLPEGAS